MSLDARLDAYLDAVDHVMNSNTLLLWAARPPGEVAVSLASFLHGPGFLPAFLQQDLERNWHNYHEWSESLAPRPGTPVIPGAVPVLSPLTAEEARGRLAWCLHGATSWYGHRAPAEEARALAEGFWAALGERLPGLSAASLGPGFLWRRGEEEEGTRLAYFDGTPCDGALLFWNQEQLALLLTNGSP